MPDSLHLVDGSQDFSGGIDSSKVTTVASESNPNGLGRNELAYLINGNLRDGAIQTRTGWKYLKTLASAGSLYQGGMMYEPENENPYLLLSLSGHILQVPCTPDADTDLSEAFGLFNPPAERQAFFCQGEQFAVIQAGDYVNATATLPLFWDGSLLRRSNGITGQLTRGNVNLPVRNAVTTTAPFNIPTTVWSSAPTDRVAVSLAAVNPADVRMTFILRDTASSRNYGTFIVANVDTVLLKETWALFSYGEFLAGATIPAGDYIQELWSPATRTMRSVAPQFFVPIVGGSAVMTLGVGAPYVGNVGDTVNINDGTTDWGDFTVLAFTGTTITLETVTSTQIGNGVPLAPTDLIFTITAVHQTTAAPPINEIPAAGPMDYYMGRLWYANQRVYSAGDIVKGSSGTLAYDFRDSILCVTENPLCLGGDGFVVPSNAGNIRALKHSANLDTALGQGQLFVFTPKSIYSLDVPIDRTAWIATTKDSQPLQKIVQITNGAVGDRSVVSVNGDLFFQSLEPGIRSLITAIRYFNQWGNTPISSNLERLLNFQDRALMRLSTGIEWNNRLIMGMRPVQTDAGVAHQALVSLDFSPVSGFAKKLPPCWEGHWEGIKALQLFSSNFGGLQRAFAVIVSDVDGSIQLWELTDFERKDISIQGDSRVTMVIEFPAFNFGNPFELKKLVTAELWLDKMIGTVDFYMEYRPDADACWHFWHRWQLCTQKDCSEDPLHPCDISYPYVETPFCEMDKTTITLPKPPNSCQSSNGRPAYQGYQFQTRLTIKGWARVRGMLLHAEKMDKPLYANIACNV